MSNARIYPNTYRTQQIERRQRQAAEILQQMDRLTANPNSETHRQLQHKAGELSRAVGSSGRSSGFTLGFHRAVREIEQNARSQASSILNRVFNALGVPGALLNQWLRGREGRSTIEPIRQQIKQALHLVNQLDSEFLGSDEAITPEHAGGRLVPTPAERRPTAQPPAARNFEVALFWKGAGNWYCKKDASPLR